MTNDEEIVQKEMANHDKHYWALVQTLKHKRKGWGELADLIGEGSMVAKAIWDKYENFDFYNPDRLGAAVSASPQPSVDIKQKCINFICQYPYPTWEQLVVLVESCFAAAPAQEPRCEYIFRDIGAGLRCDKTSGHDGEHHATMGNTKEGIYVEDSAAQEQPVEPK